MALLRQTIWDTRYSIHDTGVYDSSTCRSVRNIEFRREKLVKIVLNNNFCIILGWQKSILFDLLPFKIMSAQLLDWLFVASYTRKIEYCKNNDSLNTNLSVFLVKYINAE